MPLDVLGRPTGSAHVLLGAREPGLGGGHGLARNGGELALVAGHASGAVALRRITRDGAPLGGWICLETPQPDELQLGGITADGPGFAVVIAGTGGKTSLLRVDVTGRSALP